MTPDDNLLHRIEELEAKLAKAVDALKKMNECDEAVDRIEALTAERDTLKKQLAQAERTLFDIGFRRVHSDVFSRIARVTLAQLTNPGGGGQP